MGNGALLMAVGLISIFLFYTLSRSFAFAALEQEKVTKNSLYPDVTIKLWIDEGRNERMEILFESAHAYDLSIITPDGKNYIIYDDFSHINPNKIRDFRLTKNIDIIISEFVGMIYKNGQQNIEKIFQKEGRYCFHFSSNLEAYLGDTYFKLIAVYWPVRSVQIFKNNDSHCIGYFSLTP